MGTDNPDLYFIQARISFRRKLDRNLVLLIGVDIEFPRSTLEEVLPAATVPSSRAFNFASALGLFSENLMIRHKSVERCPLEWWNSVISFVPLLAFLKTTLERQCGYRTSYQTILMPGVH